MLSYALLRVYDFLVFLSKNKRSKVIPNPLLAYYTPGVYSIYIESSLALRTYTSMNNTIVEQLVAAINENKGTDNEFQNVQDLYDYATEWEQAKGATLEDAKEAWNITHKA